jgi:hypothetical protein
MMSFKMLVSYFLEVEQPSLLTIFTRAPCSLLNIQMLLKQTLTLEMESLYCPMGIFIVARYRATRHMAQVVISGPMVVFMRVSGEASGMGKARHCGRQGPPTQVTTPVATFMVKERILG